MDKKAFSDLVLGASCGDGQKKNGGQSVRRETQKWPEATSKPKGLERGSKIGDGSGVDRQNSCTVNITWEKRGK